MANPTLVAATLGVALGDGGVDADDLAGGVDERAARVARGDRRVGLDQAVESLGLADRQRAVERRDDPRRDGRVAVEVEGEADGHDRVADADARRVGERRRREVGADVDAQQRQVVVGIGGDDVAGVGSVLPEKRTRTSSAPATTWALVRISPSAEMITPVPTASPARLPLLDGRADGDDARADVGGDGGDVDVAGGARGLLGRPAGRRNLVDGGRRDRRHDERRPGVGAVVAEPPPAERRSGKGGDGGDRAGGRGASPRPPGGGATRRAVGGGGGGGSTDVTLPV